MGDYLVKIHGFNSLEPEMQDYCRTMLKIFDDAHEGTPNVKFYADFITTIKNHYLPFSY